MPLNAGPEFFEKQRRYEEAKTPAEKIRALEDMLSAAPSHKGAEKLRGEIKSKIAKFKKAETASKKKSGGRKDIYSVKKEGDAQVAIVGYPSAGKSTLLAAMTNAHPAISRFPYTTKLPERGTMDVAGVKLQLVEIPAVTKGSYYSERGPWFSAIRNADEIVIVVENQQQLDDLLKEFEIAKVRNTPVIVAVSKKGKVKHALFPLVQLEGEWKEIFKTKLWEHLGKIKVYTCKRGKTEPRPMVLKDGALVRDFAEHIHKGIVKSFRFARVWRKGWPHSGQRVGLDFQLREDDIVEIYS